MSKRKRYTDKRPLHSFRPDPRHWTRKGNSWKQKVAYRSEDEAWEFLEQNPKLKALNYKAYLCPICNKWHCGHEH